VDDEWLADWPWLTVQRGRWLRERFGAGTLSPARLAVGAIDNFAAFADFVASRGGPEKSPPVSAVAMAFFGPAGVPPSDIWDYYVAIHQHAAADADPATLNPFDLMLAFGCGWRRAVKSTGEPWRGRWEVAYAAMINQLRASVIATNRLLVDQFPQFALSPDDLLELPGDFTVSLLGACDCGHHRRGCRQTCRRRCCFPRHSLEAWDPLVCHLRPFVDQAVRGTATNQVLGAAFAESLTYCALEREGRILRRRVEFKRCPRCQGLYEEAACPTPGCDPPEGVPVPRVARANWLIRPEHEGGTHREIVRWVCGSCGNLYPIRFKLQETVVGDPCPICGWRPPPSSRPASITVWAKLFVPGVRRRAHLDSRLPDDLYGELGEEADAK
jgi:hypothetical protein